jgi:hypothetical protein
VKKNIFVVLCMVFSSAVLYQPVMMAQDQEEITIEDQQQDGNEQFDDFFGSSDDVTNQPDRPKKEKWSKARIVMVRLGVAAVLGAQGFYAWLQSAWAYLTSWVTCEERKA